MKDVYIIPSLILIIFLIHSCKKGDENKIKDGDGNVYNTITISSQIWLAENLKTTTYNDGTGIPLVTDSTSWLNLSTPGYCWYNNDEYPSKSTYGALYNWYAVNTGKLCPSGWHVPTDTDWTTLTTLLGGLNVAGGLLKETGTTHWLYPNIDATDSTDFTALPGGGRGTDGSFYELGYSGRWWSATANGSEAWGYEVISSNGYVYRVSFPKKDGSYIRCIKD